MKNEKTLIAFKKAKSHLEKIVSMVESGHYCIEVMQQNLAVIGLLKSAHQQLMEGHLNSCFKNAMASKDHALQDKMVKEILTVNKLSQK